MKLYVLVVQGLLLPCAMASRALAQAGPAPPTPELATALARTNYWRAQFGSPPVNWDQKAYQTAVASIQGCSETPAGTSGYGYNIGYGYPSFTTFIDKMAADKDKYDPSNPVFTPAAGLFTQLVWKASTGIGCASNVCPKGVIYICLYTPPGNMAGAFAANVNNVIANGSTTNTTQNGTATANGTMPVTGPVAATTTAAGDPPTPELAAALKLINNYRAMYQAPALKWDKAAYDAAVSYVKSCPQAISPVPNYGIIAGYGYANWQLFIDDQEGDKCNYKASSPAPGRFTQLVWKSSTAIGCAVNTGCPTPNYVCLFSPPGNVLGAFPANVETPTAAQLSTCPK